MGDAFRHLRRPDPGLRTERLLLRPWTTDDVGALVTAWEDPEVARWTGVPETDDFAASAWDWIVQNPQMVELDLSLDLAVELGGEVVGEVGLVYLDLTSDADARVELGWWTAAPHRRTGVAAEAVRLFADWVLADEGLGFSAAYAMCADGNPGSGEVARRAGFEPCDRPAPEGSTTYRRVG